MLSFILLCGDYYEFSALNNFLLREQGSANARKINETHIVMLGKSQSFVFKYRALWDKMMGPSSMFLFEKSLNISRSNRRIHALTAFAGLFGEREAPRSKRHSKIFGNALGEFQLVS
jgi:hypothetical protein